MHFSKRRFLLCFIDLLIYMTVFVGVIFVIGFANPDPNIDVRDYSITAGVFAFYLIALRIVFSLYKCVWRYANSKSFLALVLSDFLTGCCGVITTKLCGAYIGLWQCVSIITICNLITLSTRFIYQQQYRYFNLNVNYLNKIGVAIVGAGQIGALLVEELKYNKKSHYRPICFIDNNPVKIGSKLEDLPIYSENDNIIDKIKSLPIQEIFIALPSIDSESAQKMYEFYAQTGCKVKLYDFPINKEEGDETRGRVIREIKIEDLLFRNAMKFDNEAMNNFYKDKTVLVTGGGGSIGSELCRQIAKRKPKRLIILDIYENNAYDIQQELIRKYGKDLDLCVEIASVRDKERLNAIFSNYKPQIVFHAAAHKHVPLMEQSGCEAIKNNVFGTYNTADVAEKHGVEKFILISTDKAVNPTNIMGASKRLCELVIQCRTDSKTSFSAVRFGNVLGSNGSVIPLFKRQIEKGGPVTITDKRIIRYFMTIPEASQLVMTAGCMAKSGELFVLDMGKPIRIIDLAENMIKLSGFTPYKDIDIVEVGLRPGEKLYEELLMKSENLDKTDNNMIFIEKDKPLTREEVDQKLDVLLKAVKAAKNDVGSEIVKAAMLSVVPTFHNPEEVNEKADASEEMNNVKEVETVKA